MFGGGGGAKIKGSKEDSQNRYGYLWLREETMLGGGEPIVKISYGHLWLREENLCLNKKELRDLET